MLWEHKRQNTKDILIKIYVNLRGLLCLSVACSACAILGWEKECPGVTLGCVVHFSTNGLF